MEFFRSAKLIFQISQVLLEIINNILFIGQSALIYEDYFLLMPEPYLTARDQRFEWLVDYLDNDHEDLQKESSAIKFNNQVDNIAQLKSM